LAEIWLKFGDSLALLHIGSDIIFITIW